MEKILPHNEKVTGTNLINYVRSLCYLHSSSKSVQVYKNFSWNFLTQFRYFTTFWVKFNILSYTKLNVVLHYSEICGLTPDNDNTNQQNIVISRKILF